MIKMEELEKLKYPTGRFKRPVDPSQEQITDWIKTITSFPSRLRKAVDGRSDVELAMQYRPGGWTVRQVVHHCADSHLNAFIRTKLALTEEDPTIKPYDQDSWAALSDGKDLDIEHSMKILEGTHARWSHVLHGMSSEDFKRPFSHPEWDRKLTLDANTALYAWHCNHHLAHIVNALQK